MCAGIDPTWQQYDGNMYKFFTDSKTFDDAEAQCADDGGHLAKLLDSEQENFLKNYIKK